MKIYLDVSCLNRPFDDQKQIRIRIETEAIAEILEKCEVGTWEQVSSEMADIELDAMPDKKRLPRVRLLLPDDEHTLELTPEVFTRGIALQSLGLKAADALHVAAAEEIGADVFLTCDDRLLSVAYRRRAEIRVHVANPMDWLKEITHADDSR